MDGRFLGPQPAFESAVAILRGGAPADLANGIAALERAVRAGEPDACCLMGALVADGIGVPQNWPRAFDLLLDAALAGAPAARRQLMVLASPNNDQEPDEDCADAEVWRALRRSIRLESWIAPSEKRVLSTSPRIVAIRGFLSPKTCAWLIGRSVGRLKAALLYGDESATPRRLDVRTNSAFEINVLDLDLVVLVVKARIAATIGVPTGALEPPQVLHYAVGEQFAPHRDYLDPSLPGQAADVASRGQRVATFLIYLNSDFEGGETDFPLLARSFKGGAGDAVYFANVDPAGAPDPRTLHAGLAPRSGEKWLFSQWVRGRALA
jgi:hypothetical protein